MIENGSCPGENVKEHPHPNSQQISNLNCTFNKNRTKKNCFKGGHVSGLGFFSSFFNFCKLVFQWYANNIFYGNYAAWKGSVKKASSILCSFIFAKFGELFTYTKILEYVYALIKLRINYVNSAKSRAHFGEYYFS